MLVRELMTTPVHYVREQTSPQAVVALMARAHVTSLPVLDQAGGIVGVISEADILRSAIQQDPRVHSRSGDRTGESLPGDVAALMTREPYVACVNDDVADVIAVMAAHGWKSVPVSDEDRLVGVLSRSDVIRDLSRPDAEITHDVRQVFSRYGSPRWRFSVTGGNVVIAGADGENERTLAAALAAEIRGVRAVSHASTDASSG